MRPGIPPYKGLMNITVLQLVQRNLQLRGSISETEWDMVNSWMREHLHGELRGDLSVGELGNLLGALIRALSGNPEGVRLSEEFFGRDR